ncbi:wsc domain-containing protein [Ophiostoma piceae UAMH 11346]|uniref:Wsc domain-containing protein n=1 Tax=Ophiostoma piceae (strain UAMH 11346) TaxID=1262450 RepID=S3C2T9_OPHP1|nr:wsc domain-containing protein [Ophiostoma piceae UAMH 11346]
MAKMRYRKVALALAAISAVAAATTTATTTSTATATPTVYNASAASATGAVAKYAYLGCYLEVSGLNGTAPGGRSLEGTTTDEVLPGDMTVPKCLAFCGGGGSGSAYTYAGLEYARECWCGQDLSSLATQQPAGNCNLPCDGDSTTLCGGNLRISLYMLSSAPARPRAAMAVVVAALLLAL